MDTTAQPTLVVTTDDDAFWQAVGGKAWDQWQERTRSIIRENRALPPAPLRDIGQ